MISIRRLVAAAGFILFGITFSSLFTLFPKVQHLENEIFWTNCPILRKFILTKCKGLIKKQTKLLGKVTCPRVRVYQD